MFSWDFARPMEVKFSQWAIKRACKFVLKKRLGDFILGDIDLEQLDIQFSRGTILLTDLALNVDFLNQKLAGAAFVLKEGSIGSLFIKFSWPPKNCRIEVDELELVLAPSTAVSAPTDSESPEHEQIDTEKTEHGKAHDNSSSISPDVHEGVKIVAKILKWLLTSFNVRLKRLIVAFDPSGAAEEEGSVFGRSLVLRIAETEYGASIVDHPDSRPDALLGMGIVTNFLKFEGATIEFLEMDKIDKRPGAHTDLETSFTEWYAGSSAVGSTSPVLTGASSGFSGKINVTVPWRNGSLDLRKVDADVSIEPLKFCIQPSTVEWVIAVWVSLKNAKAITSSDSSLSNSTIFSQASKLAPAVQVSDVDPLRKGHLSKSIYAPANKELFPDSSPPPTHLIHNWVPLSVIEDDRTELEPDYGASIDQFFECFDEIRSSQMSSGNSGIWNWTCSVFSAITVASNLASGSGYIPVEQQHVETSLRATIAEVSVIFLFQDEDQNHSPDSKDSGRYMSDHGAAHGSLSSPNGDSFLGGQGSSSYRSCVSSMTDVHHLEARCQNAIFDFQISPQKMKFDVSVMHFMVDEYYDTKGWGKGFGFTGYKDSQQDQIILDEHLKERVQGALPNFPFSASNHDSETSIKQNAGSARHSGSSHDLKVGLLESIGKCSFEYAVASTDQNQRLATSTKFSVHLPPIILWIQFHSMKKLLKFFEQIGNYFKKYDKSKDVTSDTLGRRYNSSSPDDYRSCTSASTTVSPRTCLQGNIILHQARIILCFPSEYHEDKRCSTSLEKFIVLEHTPFGKVLDAFPISDATFPKGSSFVTSIHLNVGEFDISLVDSANGDDLDDPLSIHKRPFSATKILSFACRTTDHSGITMFWQKGPVTGPWMVKRAWSLSTSQDPRSRCKMTRNGRDFSSVSNSEDLGQTTSQFRQELILSSACFVLVHFAFVRLSIGSKDYKLLNHLLNLAMNLISNEAHDMKGSTNENKKIGQSYSGDSNVSQTSFLVECDVLDLCITLKELVEVSYSMQKELPGSWNCFKLTIEKLELLSATNIGGIGNAKYLWLKHGEGELWGSIFDKYENATPINQDFLLLTCRNSTVGRGAGGGASALSFGNAGTTFTYLRNPQLLQSHTSVIVRCGTIVAPGGRLDWINAVCLFFSLPPENDQMANENIQSSPSVDSPAYKDSFFLDLVDIALSYEPHIENPRENDHESDSEYYDPIKSNEEASKQYVACLLAAASLSMSHHTTINSSTLDFKINLQDVGFLITELSDTRYGSNDYSADYLQKSGYVKICEEALVEAILRINGLLWEIECSDLHINLDTCHDTTSGLVRLVAQLQVLYAPDVEDAVAHLQSRWNAIQQSYDENIANDATDISSSSSIASSTEKELPTSENNLSVGLLDNILENAFDTSEAYRPPSNDCNIRSKQEKILHDDSYNLSIRTSANGNGFAQRVTLEGTPSSKTGRNQSYSAQETSSPEIIESYCASVLPPPSESTEYRLSTPEHHKSKFDFGARRDIEFGKGGWYDDNSLVLIENHVSNIFNQSRGEQHHQKDMFSPDKSESDDHCLRKGWIVLKNADVRWRLHAGLDWSELMQSSVLGSNSNGRDSSICLELSLSGLNFQYDLYPDGQISVSKLSISVEDIHLYDRSRDAPWKMVLGHYSSKDHPRETFSKALKLDLETVRPDPSTPLEDCRLNVELLPIRLHLDQSQLNFLISFFGKDSFEEETPTSLKNLDGSGMSERKRSFRNQSIMEEALLPFFQKCDVRPVTVRVDYVPRHVDLAALRKGNYVELLNLVPWKGIDLHLKHVCAVGVYGWSSVCETVIGEWIEDISHNQVPKLLKGLAPVRSLFAVSSGTSKLVSLPVKSYKKDQKLLKGLQRGALAFIRSISLEAVGLGVHLAAGAHEILLQTEYMLARIPPSTLLSEETRTRTIVKSNQPEDAQQGIRQAVESLSDGLGRTAFALVGTPLKAYQRGAGAGSAIATAVRAVPAAAMAPVSASARAVHCTLLGVRNSLDPDHRKESMEKYLGPHS